MFVGKDIIPGCAPLYLAIYVDGLIYFSVDPELEKKFESDFASHVMVDFMGDAEFYLGTKFDWTRDSDSNVTCHLSQEGYANLLLDAMGLQNAVTSSKMTLYRSGLPIDTLPLQSSLCDGGNENFEILKGKYRTFLGMVNWLSVSMRPDLATVSSLLVGYANLLLDAMGLQDAVTSLKMTPNRSGLPINTLLLQSSLCDGGNENFEILKGKYRTFLGMLNWLSISRCPNLATVSSLLASATESPTCAHLDALRHVGRYTKATSDHGISFSSKPNAALKAFIQFSGSFPMFPLTGIVPLLTKFDLSPFFLP
jgi:hypothetical protein